jgi:probable F420-dependent oxidoreductase
MRFAVAIPQYDRDRFDAAYFRQHLARAEALGFQGAWVQEQVLGAAGALSPLEVLSYAAACTEKLRLGCAVFVSPLHSPLHLAKSIASLDRLSHGRVDVGIGSGGRGRQFAAFGVDPNSFVARFTEGAELMKACWTEREIRFQGRFWQLDGAAMEPKPVQDPHPPVWIGGSHPAALRRAVRIGDGFFGAGSQSTDQFVEQVQTIHHELAQQGRDPRTFHIAKRVYIHLADDAARAQAQIEDALARHYGRGVPGVAVAGRPEDCTAGLRQVARAGAELILLNPLVDDTHQMERLAAEVLPALTDTA